MKDWCRTLLTLRLGNVHVGVDVTHIQMVVGLWNRHSYVISCGSVPSGTALIQNGRAIPILNLSQALGNGSMDPRTAPVLIVVDSGERCAAVAATVTGLVRVREDEQEDLDESVPEAARIVLSGYWRRNRRRIYLLDDDMAVQCAHSDTAAAFLSNASRLDEEEEPQVPVGSGDEVSRVR